LEVVDIRRPPVGRRVGPRRWFQVELHDLMVGKGQRLASPLSHPKIFNFRM
jgi:hypothetical protein